MTVENSPDFEQILPKTPKLGDFSLETPKNTRNGDLSSMSQSELLDLHAQIENRLTGIRLTDINVEKETLIQYQRGKALQEKAASGTDIPLNQLAQVQNSIRNTLESLARMQMEIHDSETIKRWKAALIKVIREQPKEFQDAFFDALEGAAAVVEQELDA